VISRISKVCVTKAVGSQRRKIMGYRSEVTIIIQAITESVNNPIQKEMGSFKQKLDALDASEEKWAMFLAEVAVKPETELAWREISSGVGDEFCIGSNTLELDKEKRRITMNFPDIKWYEGYEDVDSYMALFHSVKPYENYFDAVYLRIGEDMEDTEEHTYGNGYSLASIERHIEIN
jgi:hypothetical protein